VKADTRDCCAATGKNAATRDEFFKALGRERAEKLNGVTVDMSGADFGAARRGAPAAQIIFDRLHVQRMTQ
jgi:transposase